MEKATKATTDKLTRLIAIARGEASNSERTARVIAWEGGVLNLTRAEAELYDDVINALLGLDGVEEKYSERYVEKALRSFLGSARENPTDVRNPFALAPAVLGAGLVGGVAGYVVCGWLRCLPSQILRFST